MCATETETNPHNAESRFDQPSHPRMNLISLSPFLSLNIPRNRFFLPVDEETRRKKIVSAAISIMKIATIVHRVCFFPDVRLATEVSRRRVQDRHIRNK